MGERDKLRDGLLARFAFLTSEFGFRGPEITDRSLLLTLLYRSDRFNLAITAELRDWFIDFHVLPTGCQRAGRGFRTRIRSHDLIKPFFGETEKALFDRAAKATAARDAWGSVPAMMEAASHQAALLRSLVPHLQAKQNRLFTAVPPNSG